MTPLVIPPSIIFKPGIKYTNKPDINKKDRKKPSNIVKKVQSNKVNQNRSKVPSKIVKQKDTDPSLLVQPPNSIINIDRNNNVPNFIL